MFEVYVVQVPALPGRLQPRHVPVQVVLQQTPSTQLPLAHGTPPSQGWPVSFTQVPPVHVWPASHCAALVHVGWQPPSPAHARPPVQTPFGSLPAGVAMQVPSCPGTLHALQPPHVDEQHTPCWHCEL